MGFSFKSIFQAAVVAAVVAVAVVTMQPQLIPVGMSATAYVATAAAIAAATTAASGLLTPDAPQLDLSQEIRGQLVTTRLPDATARVVYGETRLAGNIVFMEASGAKNETMHMVATLAGHEIDSIQTVYANDEALSLTLSGDAYTCTYKGNATALSFNWLLGSDSQSALAFLSGTAASTYRYRGIAVLASKLVYNADVFPQGMPNMTAKVRGKKVYDPRTSTTAYSNNSALCIRDYLLDTRFGLGAKTTEIDDQSFIDAADICDETITLKSGTEKRYTLNGAFLSSQEPKDVLSKMLTSCGGTLTYVGGKWTLKVAAYRTPTITITEDEMVESITMQASQSRRDIFNAVKGTYSEPSTLYQPNSFPPVTNATYESQDGEQIWKDADFPFTTSSATCERLAKIELEKARQQISVNLSCNLKAFALQPSDTVYLDFPRYGWSNKVFEVLSWEFDISTMTPSVHLTLRETASEVYDWANGSETTVDFAPNTTLPDPFTVDPVGITISDELDINAEAVLTKLVVSVTGASTFQNRYEVQAKLTSATDWVNLGQATSNRFELNNVLDGYAYNVRARAINNLNVASEWTAGTHTTIGKTAPPADVTGFSINIVGTSAYLTWTAVPDLDLSHYRIRHSRATTGATYSAAIDLIEKVPRPAVFAIAPAMTGTYFIKAIDKLGNESLASSEIVAIIEDIKGLNAIETVTESPTFSGTKTECNVTEDGYLVLDTSIDFDAKTGDFDDADGDFDGGGGTVSTEGTYEFYAGGLGYTDLGSVYTSRVTANLEVDRIDYVNLFDDRTGNFDDATGLFDGDPNNYGDTNVALYVSTTEDDPAGTPTWTAFRRFFVGDYKARAFKFKAVLTSASGESSPILQSLSVSIDMPDRVASGSDIASGTGSGGYSVTFTPAFKVAPAVGIAAQNLAQGDYYEITTKSASGFTIRFKNSSGTVVNRTFDYVAKGYGELAA